MFYHRQVEGIASLSYQKRKCYSEIFKGRHRCPGGDGELVILVESVLNAGGKRDQASETGEPTTERCC